MKVKEVIALYQQSPEFRALKPATQKGYDSYLTRLHEGFGNLTFEEVTPFLVRSYLKARSAKVGANREISLLSVLWQWAREADLTRAPNQVKGVRRNQERPRTRYVTDAELQKAIDAGPNWLADSLILGQEAKANFSLFGRFCDSGADNGGRKDGGDFTSSGAGGHLCWRCKFDVLHDGLRGIATVRNSEPDPSDRMATQGNRFWASTRTTLLSKPVVCHQTCAKMWPAWCGCTAGK